MFDNSQPTDNEIMDYSRIALVLVIVAHTS